MGLISRMTLVTAIFFIFFPQNYNEKSTNQFISHKNVKHFIGLVSKGEK